MSHHACFIIWRVRETECRRENSPTQPLLSALVVTVGSALEEHMLCKINATNRLFLGTWPISITPALEWPRQEDTKSKASLGKFA